jgi:ribulose-5-phosphate 4-epimerase/fuculose-1-phosphate aldolase
MPQKDHDIKQKLAKAYHILAHLGLDDHTYTHLSARSRTGDSFYIYPFGLLFDEVTPDNLIEASYDGEVIEGEEFQYNQTGYIIHGGIYQARKDIQAIFHIHTPEIVAVSACERGLLPISQWALHFYDRISYHNYDSLALDPSQGNDLLKDLGDNHTMLLRNHGSLTCGKTIEEAMFYTYHLQQACKAQCLALSMNHNLILPNAETCKKAVHDLLSFEKELGKRDWQAWVRLIERGKKSSRGSASSRGTQL